MQIRGAKAGTREDGVCTHHGVELCSGQGRFFPFCSIPFMCGSNTSLNPLSSINLWNILMSDKAGEILLTLFLVLILKINICISNWPVFSFIFTCIKFIPLEVIIHSYGPKFWSYKRHRNEKTLPFVSISLILISPHLEAHNVTISWILHQKYFMPVHTPIFLLSFSLLYNQWHRGLPVAFFT